LIQVSQTAATSPSPRCSRASPALKPAVNAIGESGAITFSAPSPTREYAAQSRYSLQFRQRFVRVVTNISSLGAGQQSLFSGSYFPANPCAPTLDTIFVQGTDALGSNVLSMCSATCSNILTAAIKRYKNCPPNLVQPGLLWSFLALSATPATSPLPT